MVGQAIFLEYPRANSMADLFNALAVSILTPPHYCLLFLFFVRGHAFEALTGRRIISEK